jgi:hypothetical protein
MDERADGPNGIEHQEENYSFSSEMSRSVFGREE